MLGCAAVQSQMCRVGTRQDRARGSLQSVNKAANLPAGLRKSQQAGEHSPGVQSLVCVSQARHPALTQAGSCDLWLAMAMCSTGEGQNASVPGTRISDVAVAARGRTRSREQPGNKIQPKE